MESAFTVSAELTAPAELRGPTPRRVRLTMSGFHMVIAAAILFALTAAGAVWVGRDAASQRQRDSAFRQYGRPTTAAITKYHLSGSLEPRVNYSFNAGRRTYTGTALVPKPLAPALAASHSLAVLYLPADPAINRPAAWDPSRRSDLALLVAPIFAALLGILLFVPLAVEYRMAALGTPVVAVVRKSAVGRNGFLVHYEFRLQDDSLVKGRGWYKAHQEPGAGIWVLYLPDRPGRNLPYPLTYCRPVR
jgi:hypothetical protein